MAKKMETKSKESDNKSKNVIKLKDLNDESLVPELEKRIKLQSGGLGFVKDVKLREFLGSLSNYFKEIRGENQLDANEVSSRWGKLIGEAVTYLKGTDTREWSEKWGNPSENESRLSLKAFGVEKLQEYFMQFMEFEKVMYGAVSYYRNHSLHVFRVWMLGAILLSDMIEDDKCPGIQIFGDNQETERITKAECKGLEIKTEEIQAMWCIIALTHDLGYPLQKTEAVSEQTRKMLRSYGRVDIQDLSFNVPQQHQFINDFILRFISSKSVPAEDGKEYKTHLQSKYYLKFSKALEDYEHGIFSAIILMKNLTYFLESDFDFDDVKLMSKEDARQCAIRREILRAIASHTCEQIYHLHPYTLSFLLIVCDELQSWGRPTFEEMEGDSEERVKSRLVRFSTNEIEYELELPDNPKVSVERTRHLFKKHHKLFRAAVDAKDREDCKCIIKVRSETDENGKAEFRFHFKSSKKKPPQFKFTANGNDWNIYDEQEPHEILNPSTNDGKDAS